MKTSFLFPIMIFALFITTILSLLQTPLSNAGKGLPSRDTICNHLTIDGILSKNIHALCIEWRYIEILYELIYAMKGQYDNKLSDFQKQAIMTLFGPGEVAKRVGITPDKLLQCIIGDPLKSKIGNLEVTLETMKTKSNLAFSIDLEETTINGIKMWILNNYPRVHKQLFRLRIFFISFERHPGWNDAMFAQVYELLSKIIQLNSIQRLSFFSALFQQKYRQRNHFLENLDHQTKDVLGMFYSISWEELREYSDKTPIFSESFSHPFSRSLNPAFLSPIVANFLLYLKDYEHDGGQRLSLLVLHCTINADYLGESNTKEVLVKTLKDILQNKDFKTLEHIISKPEEKPAYIDSRCHPEQILLSKPYVSLLKSVILFEQPETVRTITLGPIIKSQEMKLIDTKDFQTKQKLNDILSEKKPIELYDNVLGLKEEALFILLKLEKDHHKGADWNNFCNPKLVEIISFLFPNEKVTYEICLNPESVFIIIQNLNYYYGLLKILKELPQILLAQNKV